MPSTSRILALLSSFVFAAALLARPAAAACPTCVPLDDLSGPLYLGVHSPGLYPGATNSPPPAHLALALAAAGSVVPRDAGGAPNAAGWIGMLAIGMSNCNQEFAVFERIADSYPSRNARLLLVDAAVGGQSADVIWPSASPYWTTVLQRVRAAGLDNDQVQVVWLKEAEGGLVAPVFPAHAESLKAHVRAIVRNLKDLFPSLQLCFLSSRIYGGYNPGAGLGEPVSYEGGFAMRWLIEDQIDGAPDLNADAALGAVEAPVLLWGPYLWANGATPRASDGLTWLSGDLEGDFVHPSPSGEAKVAALLDGFFNSNVAATPWYLNDPGVDLDTLGAVADAHVDTASPASNFGASGVVQWAYNNMRAYVKFDLEGVTAVVKHAKLGMQVPANTANRPIEVVGVTNTLWDEMTVTAASAPAFDGGVVDTIPMASRGTAVGVDVTAEVLAALAQAPGSRRVTFGLRAFPGPATVQEVLSRESGEGPWLVLTTEAAATAVEESPPMPAARIALTVRPNPSRGEAELRLELPRGLAGARVAVFDPGGRRVRTLHAGALGAGAHRWMWDGRDTRGVAVPAGAYWLRLDGGEDPASARLVILP